METQERREIRTEKEGKTRLRHYFGGFKLLDRGKKRLFNRLLTINWSIADVKSQEERERLSSRESASKEIALRTLLFNKNHGPPISALPRREVATTASTSCSHS